MLSSDFNAEEWMRLTRPERAERCRREADEARRLSIKASGDMKLSYTELAESWDQLADEIERRGLN